MSLRRDSLLLFAIAFFAIDCRTQLLPNSLCSDGIEDGAETDIDCGGGVCQSCSIGKHCAINSDCVGMMCVAGVCTTSVVCAPPHANCDGLPASGCDVDTSTDPQNCGSCGTVCPPTDSCVAGICQFECPTGQSACNNACVNLQTDASNCGQCGVVCSIPGTTCTNGKCPTLQKVLLIATLNTPLFPKDIPDVQTKLMSTGSFSVVDIFDAMTRATPTVEFLAGYDAVFVIPNEPTPDPVGLGDSLGSYFDGGGRVVLSIGPIANGSLAIAGKFAANDLLTVGPRALYGESIDSLGVIHEPSSPLLAGVHMFSAQAAFRYPVQLAPGAVSVADWSTGEPLVFRGQINGRNRVDLNFIPISNDAEMGLWTGDGASLMRNALLF